MQVDLLVVVEQGEDGWLVGEVPTLPGCVSQGRTMEELKANMADAIVGWLEVAQERVAQEATALSSTTFYLPFALNG